MSPPTIFICTEPAPKAPKACSYHCFASCSCGRKRGPAFHFVTLQSVSSLSFARQRNWNKIPLSASLRRGISCANLKFLLDGAWPFAACDFAKNWLKLRFAIMWRFDEICYEYPGYACHLQLGCTLIRRSPAPSRLATSLGRSKNPHDNCLQICQPELTVYIFIILLHHRHRWR